MIILRIWKTHKCGKCLQSFRTSYLCLIRNTHYDTLGVKPTATQSEIRLAYLKGCKKRHPDMNPNDPKSHEKFVLLSTAYNILSDKSSRRKYDETINNPGQRVRPMYNSNTMRSNPYRHSNEYRSGSRESWTYYDFSANYAKSKDFRNNTTTHPKANYTLFDKTSEFMMITFMSVIMIYAFINHILKLMSKDINYQIKLCHRQQKHYSFIPEEEGLISTRYGFGVDHWIFLPTVNLTSL